MESVSRISRNADLFQRELFTLSQRGKGDKLVELYRRMAAVAAKRCEAFFEEEKEEENEKQKEKEKEVGDTGTGKKIEGASGLLASRANDLSEQESKQRQTPQRRSHAGIEVLR